MRVTFIQSSILRFCLIITVLSSAFKQKQITVTSTALRVDSVASMKLASEKFLVLGTGSWSRKTILTNAGVVEVN
jgi:hypothetical protein